MGCGPTCFKTLGYQQLDPETETMMAHDNSRTPIVTDLGVPDENEVITALQDADDDELNLSDAELERYLKPIEAK
jgi:hypothetical protein